MDLSIATLVSVDKRRVYTLRLPFVSERPFRGVSLAELLDDVALHLMETVPKLSPDDLTHLPFCPHVELHRVLTTFTPRANEDDRNPPQHQGRYPVVLRRWPEDSFYLATVPTLGTRTFAVRSPSVLDAALASFLEDAAERLGLHDVLNATCEATEYIEILEVDLDLPTILPSRKAPKKKKKKTKKSAKNKPKNKQKDTDEPQNTPPKRELVAPHTLRTVGTNLNHLAIDGRLPATWGRDAIVTSLTRQLLRPGAAILLVGPRGVGKTAIIQGVVQRLAERNLPLHLRNDVWAVDANRLIAGMSFVGAWEQRVKQIVHEIDARNDILYVNDLPALVYAGRSAHSESNIAEFLEPHIARGELRILGECTSERLEAIREEAPGFFSRFQLLQIPELSEEQTLPLLVQARRTTEITENAVIHPDALEAVLALTRRFMPQDALPGKALTLFQRLVTDYHKVEEDDFGRRVITRDTLTDFFARTTGLPSFILWEQEARRFSELLAFFEERIIAQEPAARTAAQIVTTLQHGLNDPHKPLATLLFVGPTGVGKTETAKALADLLFGTRERLLRFDMSELRDPGSAARLFGDRFNPEGELTRKVRENPFSVVLFDEIEKADPAVFDAFLQVFGEGRLTNAAGYTTDFCNTILIMTSNLGVRQAQQSLGFGESTDAQNDLHFRKAAEGFFRPELFNRIDHIIAFRPLGRDAIEPLVRRTLQELLSRRGLQRSGVVVRVEPALVNLLVDLGFDPRYGARSMKRALEQRLTVPLAAHLVAHPTHATTLIDLYQRGRDIGMDIQTLEDTAPAPTPPAQDTRNLQPRFDRLRALLDTLRASEDLRRAEKQRSLLLKRFNDRETLPDAELTQLESLNHLLNVLNTLNDQLDELHDTFLSDFSFFEEIDIISPSLIENRQRKPHLVGTERPFANAPEHRLLEAHLHLLDRERTFAELHFRAEALLQPPQRLLLRLLPAADATSTLAWTADLTRALRDHWGNFAYAATWARSGPQGPWTHPPPPDDADLDAWALVVTGYGVHDLVAPEHGFHIRTRTAGPDLICDIARLDRFDLTLDQDPLALLTSLDDEYRIFCENRTRGDDAPSPLGHLPVARRLDAEDLRPTGHRVGRLRLDAASRRLSASPLTLLLQDAFLQRRLSALQP